MHLQNCTRQPQLCLKQISNTLTMPFNDTCKYICLCMISLYMCLMKPLNQAAKWLFIKKQIPLNRAQTWSHASPRQGQLGVIVARITFTWFLSSNSAICDKAYYLRIQELIFSKLTNALYRIQDLSLAKHVHEHSWFAGSHLHRWGVQEYVRACITHKAKRSLY